MKDRFNLLLSNSKDFIKKNNNAGIIALIAIVLVFIIITIIYLLGTGNVSSIEKKEIREKSDNLILYIEDIANNKSKELDKYIIFALNYSYNINGKAELTSKEIEKFLNDNFSKKYKEKDILETGVTPLMLEYNITFNNVRNSYTLNVNRNATSISETPIVYYKMDKIRKNSRKKYTVTYREYIIENPYEILNFYIEKNKDLDEKDIIDITFLKEYLIGNGKLNDVKKLIKNNEKDLKEYAKKGKKIKISYEVKKDELYITKIK